MMNSLVQQMPCTMWSKVWKISLENMDINGMLVQSFEAMGKGVIMSPIKHPMAITDSV